MKIELQCDNVQINIDFDGFEANTDQEVIMVMDKVREIISDCIRWKQGNVAQQKEVVQKEIAVPAQPAVQPPRRDDFGIRERLPNNVVDVRDLNVQQAVTENALVRCPKCGQAHVLVVNCANDMYMLRKDYAKNEFVIVRDFDIPPDDSFVRCCRLDDETKLEYFYRMQSEMSCPDTDFVVNNETEVFCPVCKQSSTFIDWKNAWENPLSFFEHEDVCEVCGGEMLVCVNKNNKNSSQNSFVKECSTCGKHNLVDKRKE